MRIDHGPGYRIYFLRDGDQIIALRAGGDESTQQTDIDTAYDAAESWHQKKGDFR